VAREVSSSLCVGRDIGGRLSRLRTRNSIFGPWSDRGQSMRQTGEVPAWGEDYLLSRATLLRLVFSSAVPIAIQYTTLAADCASETTALQELLQHAASRQPLVTAQLVQYAHIHHLYNCSPDQDTPSLRLLLVFCAIALAA